MNDDVKFGVIVGQVLSVLALILGIILALMLNAFGVHAYNYNATTNFTIIINPDSLTLLFPNGSVQSWNSSVYGTYGVSMGYYGSCADLNASNYTAYFDVLREQLVGKLIPIITNSTTNIPQSFVDDMHSMIYTYVTDGMDNATVSVRDNITLSINENCNQSKYIDYMDGIFMGRIMQNLTDYDNLQKDYSSCTNDRDVCDVKRSYLQSDNNDKDKSITYLTIIIGGLLLGIALLAYSIWGGGRGDIFEKLKWRRRSAEDLRAPKTELTIQPGSDLLREKNNG